MSDVAHYNDVVETKISGVCAAVKSAIKMRDCEAEEDNHQVD